MGYSTPFQAAFTSKIRVTKNKSPKGDKPADQRLACDFTVEAAKQAAAWLVQRAQQAENEGESIRVYTSKEDYTETTGFTMWGSLWGNSGSISPGVIRNDNEAL